MATGYNMSRISIGADDRISVTVHIINATLSIEESRQISIVADYSVAELKFEIERALSIQQEHQKQLTILSPSLTGNDTIKASEHVLDSEDAKLTEYNIKKDTIIELELTDNCTWRPNQTAIEMQPSTPLTANTQQQQSLTVQSAAAQRQGGSAADELISFLTKHSKIQCRILLIVFV